MTDVRHTFESEITDSGNPDLVGPDEWNAAHALPAWQDYTPALTASTTNPTLGSGSAALGRYMQIGKTVIGWATFGFGASGVAAGSGIYFISLPVAATAAYVTRIPCGSGVARDSSTANRNIAVPFFNGNDLDKVEIGQGTGQWGNAQPWTWAANDTLAIFFTYEAA